MSMCECCGCILLLLRLLLLLLLHHYHASIARAPLRSCGNVGAEQARETRAAHSTERRRACLHTREHTEMRGELLSTSKLLIWPPRRGAIFCSHANAYTLAYGHGLSETNDDDERGCSGGQKGRGDEARTRATQICAYMPVL